MGNDEVARRTAFEVEFEALQQKYGCRVRAGMVPKQVIAPDGATGYLLDPQLEFVWEPRTMVRKDEQVIKE